MNTIIESPASLIELAEKFIPPPSPQGTAHFSTFLDALRQAATEGNHDEVKQALSIVATPVLDYTLGQSLYRVVKSVREQVKPRSRVKLAVLSSFTTKQLTSFLDLFLFASGVEADLYEAEYGVFRQEILDPQSSLYAFAPGIVILAVSSRDLVHRPTLSAHAATVDRMIKAEQAEWSALWEQLHQRLGCQVIQNNFVAPAWRVLANHEMARPSSTGSYIAEMNRSLQRNAPPYVTIHDVDHLAGCAGRRHWDDPRFVHQAKMPCAPDHLIDYAHSLASLVGVQLGLAKKCLVLDLDNTLWGGVIGDDGLGGIRLGQGNPEGEAYLAFQEYLKALRLRGVILAVCSKNQEEVAKSAFTGHPEMVLKLDDIACFVANWNDKATNISSIASELNIGLNSLVFADDNPSERSIVRKLLPEVAVPELPDDAALYIQAVDRHRYFQTNSIGAEDLQRTAYYRSDALRRVAQTSVEDINTFLKSLEMVAEIRPINSVTLERSVQLIQRSNQFNLTTRRKSAAEVSALMSNASWITRTVSLRDRFGDNGLISVVLARNADQVLEIDTWLMSCRVLKRGVEHCLLNHISELARQRGLKRIRGEYIPTNKNELVRNHFAELGFHKITEDREGRTVWELNVENRLDPLQHFITEISD